MEAVVRVTRLCGIECFGWPSMAIIWFKYIYKFDFFLLYVPHFFLSWRKDVESELGRKIVWMKKDADLYFARWLYEMFGINFALSLLLRFYLFRSSRALSLFWTERQKLSRIEELAYFFFLLLFSNSCRYRRREEKNWNGKPHLVLHKFIIIETHARISIDNQEKREERNLCPHTPEK